MIAEVSPNNATQPLSLLWNGQVLAPPQFDLHIPQLCLHPLSHRLTLQLKPSLAMLQQRAVKKNGDWNDFWDYRIDCERDRRYPAIYQKAA